VAAAPPSLAISGTAIAGDAGKYIGHPYVFGGHPGIDGLGGWDCSSFVNWVLGHDFGMKLPGSARAGYDGTSHGPVVINYASWSGAKTVASAEAGDLCIWPGLGSRAHIGIAISPSQMVSALNPNLGTIQSGIAGNGPAGVPLVYRRIAPTAGQPLSGCVPMMGLIVYAQKILSRRAPAYRLSGCPVGRVSPVAEANG
jgi:cell wall-associated NlpC family hydrolase